MSEKGLHAPSRPAAPAQFPGLLRATPVAAAYDESVTHYSGGLLAQRQRIGHLALVIARRRRSIPKSGLHWHHDIFEGWLEPRNQPGRFVLEIAPDAPLRGRRS